MKAFAAFILPEPLAEGDQRQGLGQGALVAAMAAGLLAGLLAVATGGELALPALRIVLEQWLPVLGLAGWLRRSVSLSSTLLLWAGLGALAVTGFYLAVGDPVGYWRGVVDALLAAAGAQGLGPEAEALLQEELLPMMTSLWAMNMMLMVLAGLLIGRGLQALLYNPGGLRAEFHGLSLGRTAAVGALALWLGAVLTGPGLLYDLAVVTGAAFVLQALAFAHAVVAARGWGRGWLVPVYLLAPLLFRVLALVGIGEALFQWRRRLIDDHSAP
ncbi:hypothetical protein [Halorhodospira neutriphila]|uniref:DUF2232 domain-containing protein n=1 Tax=Halorhodospira neutriphila TaxID=168379 RepID=A0ABS1E5W0_9GAMM|nr:hypothetical protein [Halorhodospira neutriphila]MBK1727131.1 hypothetical protein [Halorhodospira neutriphila]